MSYGDCEAVNPDTGQECQLMAGHGDRPHESCTGVTWTSPLTKDERVAALEAQLAEANRKLEALDWKPITPENLPKVGDEVWQQGHDTYVVLDKNQMRSANDYGVWGWTHFRPINPPSK